MCGYIENASSSSELGSYKLPARVEETRRHATVSSHRARRREKTFVFVYFVRPMTRDTRARAREQSGM